ncbi:MAG: HAD family hydrolase [Zoogloea sp.]|nr:HAD family hydrolase [Zoogloea sp.]
MSAAVFIDKDGTLLHDVPHNVDPRRIRLRRDAGPALARLRAAGYALVLVTNQPGVALGLFNEYDLGAVWYEIAVQLARRGVALDAIHYCPHHPDGSHPRHARACTCRKPQPGLLLRAAAERGYDLARSWLVGDILDDVEAGRRAGCRTILLDAGSETEWRDGPLRRPHFVAASLSAAAEHIARHPLPIEEAAWTR